MYMIVFVELVQDKVSDKLQWINADALHGDYLSRNVNQYRPNSVQDI
jgi:hypothetical protein